MTARPGGWTVTDPGPAPVAELLAPFPGSPAGRLVRVARPADSAVVLGSTQPASSVDQAAAGRLSVAVLRRRSGGGAVVVAPSAQLWLDVWVPRSDGLWDDDVVRSSWWLGAAWGAALSAVGVDGAEVHQDRAAVDDLSRLVCFAGRGPGEVFVSGRKVVGVAQRRDRHGALLSCMVLRRWDPASLSTVLRNGEGAPVFASSPDAPVAAGIEDLSPDVTCDELLAALVASLPQGE